jgi:hypothetical protein
MDDFASYWICDYFSIPVFRPVDHSLQSHPTPTLAMKIIASFLLDKRTAACSVPTL